MTGSGRGPGPKDGAPPIVLPVGRRGIAVTDRVCWWALGGAMAASAALILYLNRGGTFYVDELYYFTQSRELGLHELLEPVNGHLIAVQRLYTKLFLEAFGATYLPFRLLHVASVLVAAGVFYVLAKRRIGALPALAPAIVLLFLGSAWQHVVVPIGTPVLLSIAAGLGALLSLERSDRSGDVIACGLLCASVATFSVGLAFLVGVALSVVIDGRWSRRAWIFLVPFVLYAAWWVWAAGLEQSGSEHTRIVNVLLIPAWTLDSIAVVAAALVGLDYDFDAGGRPELVVGAGYVLAAAAIAAVAYGLRRGAPSSSLWVSLAIALSYWALGALAAGVLGREPALVKYVYPGAIVTLLVLTDAGRKIRFTRAGLVALFGVVALSLATNLALLREGGAYYRNAYSDSVKTQLAMVELARERVSALFNPFRSVPDAALDAITARANGYLEAVDRFGSPAYSLSELELRPEPLRETADRVLADAIDLRLEREPQARSSARCVTAREPAPGGGVLVEVPRDGARLQAHGARRAPVIVGRFADLPTAEVGALGRGAPAALRIPADSSTVPWRASIQGVDAVVVCPLRAPASEASRHEAE